MNKLTSVLIFNLLFFIVSLIWVYTEVAWYLEFIHHKEKML